MIKFQSKNPNDILEQLQKEICCLEEQIQQIVIGGLGWALTGNTVTPTSFIGSNNLADFVVKTNGQERMRVLASGLVGVNTSAPTAPLDINGQIRVRGGSPGAGKVLQSDADGLATWVTLPPSVAARNGLSVNTGYAVLGQDVNEVGDPAALLSSRQIPMNGQTIHHTGTGGISVGYVTPTTPFTNIDINGTLGVTQNLGYPTYGFVGGSMASFNLVHGSGSYGVAITRAGGNLNGANLAFLRTWGVTANVKGAVPPGNMIGRISFQAVAADNNTVSIGSSIIAWAATSPNSNIVKSYITFPVTTDAGGQSGNRTIISSNANVSFTDSFNLFDPNTGETDFSKLRLEQSLTGALAYSTLSITPTWNTTGTPTAIKMDVTDIASNAASLLMDLQIGGNSKFKVSKTITDIAGQIAIRGGSPGVGKVLTSDGAGLATWETISTSPPVTGANSGVRLDGTIVKLGGQLLQNATIPIIDPTLSISISGINTSSNAPTFSVSNTGSGGIAMRGTTTADQAYGVMGMAGGLLGAAGVYGQGTGQTGYGVYAQHTGTGIALNAISQGNAIVGISNSASSSSAIYGQSYLTNGFTPGSGTGVEGRTGTGNGVVGTAQSTGTALYGVSGSGLGIYANSSLTTFKIETDNATYPTTGIHLLGTFAKYNKFQFNGPPVAGFGFAINHNLSTNNGNNQGGDRTAMQQVVRWTDAADATRTSAMDLILQQAGVSTTTMSIVGNKNVVFTGVTNFVDNPFGFFRVVNSGNHNTLSVGNTGGAAAISAFSTGTALIVSGGTQLGGGTTISQTQENNNVLAALAVARNASQTNLLHPVIDIIRRTGDGTGGTVGFGSVIRFIAQFNNTLNEGEQARIYSTWIDPTDGTSDADFSIATTQAGVSSRKLYINNLGQVTLDKYGVGTFNTIPDKMLGVTATGNIVEAPVNMVVVASNDALVQTATFSPITYNIPAGADVVYIVSGFINVTAIDAGSSITHTISFTDVNSNARTLTIAWRAGDGAGTAQSNTPGTAVQMYTSISPTFKAKAGTTITVTSTLSGTPTWDSHYTLMKIR